MSNYITFGGNPINLQRGDIGEIHLMLEPKSIEALSGLHIEIIAASASFCNVHFNGERILQVLQKRPIKSRFKGMFKPKSASIYKFDLSSK